MKRVVPRIDLDSHSSENYDVHLVVVHFDVVEENLPCFMNGPVDFSPNPFPALNTDIPLAEAVLSLQREKIIRALTETGGNKAQASLLLGVAPSNLNRLIKKLDLNLG